MNINFNFFVKQKVEITLVLRSFVSVQLAYISDEKGKLFKNNYLL